VDLRGDCQIECAISDKNAVDVCREGAHLTWRQDEEGALPPHAAIAEPAVSPGVELDIEAGAARAADVNALSGHHSCQERSIESGQRPGSDIERVLEEVCGCIDQSKHGPVLFRVGSDRPAQW